MPPRSVERDPPAAGLRGGIRGAAAIDFGGGGGVQAIKASAPTQLACNVAAQAIDWNKIPEDLNQWPEGLTRLSKELRSTNPNYRLHPQLTLMLQELRFSPPSRPSGLPGDWLRVHP